MTDEKPEEFLTDEEIKILEKMQSKLLDLYAKNNPKDYEKALDFENKEYLVTPPPITNTPKEIIFLLKVLVTQVSPDGTPEKTLDLMEQNYHIPLAPNKDHNEYIEKFISKFRSDLEKTCQEQTTNE